MNDILLSIVIANYNYGRFLESAIKSVLDQNRDDVELIVIDGGSSDNSVEVIRKYENRIAYWVSEKDRGQSHAFNKGFSRANGRFLTWLNADDVMACDTVAKLAHGVKEHPGCEWFIGGCCWVDQDMKIMLCTRARPLSRIRALGGDIQAYGPSSFFSRALYDRVGGYVDERYHYMMDIELWNRFYHKAKASYQMLPGYVWGFRMHPESKTSGQRFAESSMSSLDDPSWARKKAEYELNASQYCTHRVTMLRRIMSVSWRLVLLGKLDTFLYRGRQFGRV